MANSCLIKETKISSGDLVKVYQVIKDKDKERTQIYEGRVISIRGRAPNKTFTVRKIGIDNVGIERIFPTELPSISKVEVKKSFPARRAKLYYLREN
ncbi:50S ribosomal protein L19 [Candidatus Shapirobacteria bacterium CG03_land_8_20_14_0_80_40_19]|uniref:50S ribosomal protein L19 n=2 Tax=Candidatus Shapironibacteriota TaxID=1752721 RepID=A0A2M7BAZ0_9BACT|nr:MAG: 50S ribosomal protein L19 [Candidatus Shapirobacteria bacterium CG11_big_fil_rev_8_21_14_0_20_40_12]PIV00272.1 MAG: 50S ribosomal protein L19 [Candidatus Shapirobacteria bacterium CG03_land_8_20_14_0_80_40_19]